MIAPFAATAPAQPPPIVPAPPAAPSQAVPTSTARPGFEQFLGTKMLVWLGGLALAVACGFFMHYAFKNSFVTPKIRILGGAGFGVALIIVADRLKKNANVVAQACSGAGIACLYIVIYSAFYFYQFINSPTSFLLSVIVTAAAVLFALRHGPFTAILGLLGGFTMPILLRTGEPMGGVFFGYLILLQLALVAVGRHRGWWMLSVLSLAAATLWGIASAIGLFPIGHRVWPELLFLGMAGVYVFASWPGLLGSAKPAPRWLGVLGVCIALLLLVGHVGVGRYEPRGLTMLGVMAAGTLVLARFDPRMLRLPWAALAAIIGMLLAYGAWLQQGATVPADGLRGYAWAASGYAAVMVLGGWLCGWRSEKAEAWAGVSVVSGLAVFAVSVAGLWDAAAPDFRWWAVATGAAGVYLLMAGGRFRGVAKTDEPPGQDAAVNQWAAAVLLFATGAIGLAGYDDSPWMRLGWAGLVVAVTLMYFRLGITCLRSAVVALSWLVGTCAVYPGPLFSPIADTPVWNQLLLGYGGSAALLSLAAWWSYRQSDTPLSRIMQGIVLTILGLAGLVLTRHAFVETQWQDPVVLYESATLSITWLTFGIVSAALGRRWNQRVPTVGGAVLAIAGAIVAVIISGAVLNPLWHVQPVGDTPIFNALLWVYLLPVALILLYFFVPHREDAALRGIRPTLGVLCLVLIFIWISLGVRHGFAGSVLALTQQKITDAEWYAYSMAWVALGVFLLIVGILTRSPTARWGSLAIMLLTVGKVFIFDAAGLKDLYRVLSFFGLGVSLIALGYVYQRFVFRKPDEPIDPTAEPADQPA